MSVTEETPQTKKQRSAKAKALLAGGLIAGIGITATLASWNTGALGEWLVAGGDTPVSVELQDADGNWVATDEDGAATLLSNSSLSSLSDWDGNSNRTRETGWIENRVRVTGLAPDETYTLSTSMSAEADNPALQDAWVHSFIDLTDGSGTCAGVPQGGRHELVTADGGEVLLSFLDFFTEPHAIALTGDFDHRVCT
ncbi:MAG: hypothetical protein ACRDJC_22725, partial [Thermomicrobiales bacterium]